MQLIGCASWMRNQLILLLLHYQLVSLVYLLH